MFIYDLDENGNPLTTKEMFTRMGINIKVSEQTNKPNREARRKLKKGG